jgi:uncharacterized protein YdhG (YjbR/CyaY superfamily)
MKDSPEIESWFETVPESRVKRLRSVCDRILSRFPEAVVSMRYRMPTFEVGEAWMAVASQKHYVSVYTCARPHIEPYLKVHPETKSGTGCLNFPDRAEIDLEALDAVIDHALGSPRPIPHRSPRKSPAQKNARPARKAARTKKRR